MMMSLKLEQIVVIKFLTLEGCEKREIFLRLRNIFKNFTLPKLKVYRLYSKFHKENMDDSGDELLSKQKTNEPIPMQLSDSESESENCDSGISYSDEALHKLNVITEQKVLTKDGNAKNNENSTLLKLKRKSSKDSDKPLQNVNTTDSGNNEKRLKISNLSTQSQSECAEGKEQYISNLEASSLLRELPIIPSLNSRHSLKLLEEMHTSCTCLLCNGKSFPFRSHLKNHLSTHIRHSVLLHDSRSLLCKRSCMNNKGHYHCSHCSMISPHSSRVLNHFTKLHKGTDFKSSCRSNVSSCICVDVKEGIFLVMKSKFGLCEPIHVKKMANESSQCSQELCQKAMKVAKLNGNIHLECKHLREVKKELTFPPPSFTLTEKNLNGMNLSHTDVLTCLSLSSKALQQEKPLIVEWVSNDKLIYFSVFCEQPFGSMGRTLVQFFIEENQFLCSCPLRMEDHFCVYKIISEIYYKINFS